MQWQHIVAYFFGGAFLANSLPHLLTGVTGRPFPSPFASPPFRGLSAPPVNVAWGLVNLAVAYLLVMQVGAFDLHDLGHAGAAFGGFGAQAFLVARSLGRSGL
jgi:hypothetical protein